MPKIENVAFIDVVNGNYQNKPEESVLIQIVGVGENFPTPKHKFKEVYKFQFDDLIEETEINKPRMLTKEDAQNIYFILLGARELGLNVTVHCLAGLSRSGAVAEFGEMLGFDYIGRTKTPNVYIKNLLVKVSGMGYY